MKRFALGISLLLCALFSSAQTAPVVDYGPGFEEPEKGSTRLFMTENGNTVFFLFDEKKGIVVTIYDQKHRRKASSTINGKGWKTSALDHSELRGMYEINGDIVLFLMQLVNRAPTLFRIVINAQTGKVINEEAISVMPKINMGTGYAVVFGGLELPAFHIAKDPHSGYYAVVRFNTLTSDRDERIQVKHYSPDHKEIHAAYYDSPGYKYMQFKSMYVHKDEFVFLITNGYNTRSSGGKDSRVIMSRLKKGELKFDYEMLGYTDDFEDVRTAIQYDEPHKMLQVVLQTRLTKSMRKEMNVKKSEGTHIAFINYIDPFSNKLQRKQVINYERTNDYQRDRNGRKDDFLASLQSFVINGDGTTTILMEEIDIDTHRNSRGHVTYSSTLNDIGIVKLDALGQEISGYAIRKKSNFYHEYSSLTMYAMQNGGMTYRGNSFWGRDNMQAFYSYRYLNTGNYEYILFNDLEKNIEENDWKKEPKLFMGVSDLHTVCYRKKGNDIEKFYLFKSAKENPKDVNRFVIIESMAISRDNKQIAAVIVERRGKDKLAHIAWASFE